MDGIVVGIAQININQKLSFVTLENSASDYNRGSSVVMSLTEADLEATFVSEQGGDNTCNNVCEAETVGECDWKEVEDLLKENKIYRKGHGFSERRQLPPRESKEYLLRKKEQTIKKPVKRVKQQGSIQNLTYAKIRSIYINKKITNFKPSSLETIFEETPTLHEQDCSRLMGVRKIRRSLSFSDGFKYSRTIINKRRTKIKKIFGKRFSLKKISLEELIKKLNDNAIINEDRQERDSLMESDESEILMSNTAASNDEISNKVA